MPIPSEPVYGVADGGTGHDDVVGAPYKAAAADGYVEPAVKRGTLAPLRTASYQGGAAGNGWGSGQDLGGSYAMQAVDAPAGAPAPIGKRYAASDYPDRPSYGYQPRYDDKPRHDGYKPESHGDRYARPDHYSHNSGGYGDDYVVVEGDTLFSIAKRHGLTTTELAELNGISGSTIFPGQHLRVRGAPKYTGAPYAKDRYAKDGYDSGHGEDAPSYKRGEADGYADDRKAPVPYRSYSDYRPAPHHGGYPRPDGYRAPADDRSGYDDGVDRSDDARDERYGKNFGDKPSYGDKPGRYERQGERYASRYERDKPEEAEDHGPAPHPAPKGSYYNYPVQPGDTLFSVARRNGLNQRALADYNDIPSTATLFPGQILRLPKGRGYDWHDGARSHQESDEGEADYGSRDRDRDRDGYQRRTPYSQNTAPDDRRGGERRVAKAEQPSEPKARGPQAEPAEARTRTAQAEPVADKQREPSAPPASQAQPILAAQRDVNAVQADAGAGASQSEPKDCEAMLASPIGRSASTFREPVQGVIVGKFGSKEDGSVNDGIDFSVPKGTPVKAAENGVVAYVGNELAGFGNLILVRHADGYVTAYAHNDEMMVHRCDQVKRGEVIAKAGATGKVTKPQLHFELRKDSKPVDPEAFFSRS